MWEKLSQKWLERTINHCYAHAQNTDEANNHFGSKYEDCTLCQQFSKILIEENLHEIPIIFLWDQFHSGIIE